MLCRPYYTVHQNRTNRRYMLHPYDHSTEPFQAENGQPPQPGPGGYPFQSEDEQPEHMTFPFQAEDEQPPQPGAMAFTPATPPPDPGDRAAQGRPPRRGWRTASIALLALLLAIVFGVGLFSGWVYGRN